MDDETPELHPFAQALIDAHAAIAPKLDAARTSHTVDLLEQFETDMAPYLAPFVEKLLASPALSDEHRPLVEALSTMPHFGLGVIAAFGLGAVISPTLSTVTAPALRELANDVWHIAATTPGARGTIRPSPDLLAASVLKGVLDQGTGQADAAYSGVSAPDFDIMVQTAGQSIGLEEALLLWRRGQIDDAMLRSIIQYSNINPKFYGIPELLKYVPPPVGESIAGALKHHLDPKIAAQNIAHAGIDPANFDWMLASAGRPIGLEESLHLLNRGIMTEADVRQSIAQSDINDAYTDFALELRHYFPPPRSIVPMLKAGAINDAQASQLLGFYGVGEPWLSAFLTEGHTTRTTAERHLSVSQIINAYEEHVITRVDAAARIVALKYLPADADLLLAEADAKKADKTYAAAIRRTYARYVTHKITVQVAHQELTTLLLPAASVDQLLAQWGPERDANAPVLTVSNLQGAYHRGILTLDEFVIALQSRGYAPLDIKILAAEAWPPTRVPKEVLALPN